MSRNALIAHAAAAAVALILAYVAWDHARYSVEGDEESEPTVVVADIGRDQLRGIVYRTEKRTVEVDLARDQGPSWVTVTSKTKVRRPRPEPEPPAAGPDAGAQPDAGAGPDAGGAPSQADAALAAADAAPEADAGAGPDAAPAEADAAPAEPSPPEPEYEEREQVVRFVASKVLDEVVENLAPLKVVRRLGKLSSSQLAEFELDEPQGRLELELAEGSRTLQVGARTFGGGNHYYVRDDENGEVYLMSAGTIQNLEMAPSRLFQRVMHDFEPSDIAGATITSGGGRRTLEQRNRQNPRDRRWVDPERPEASAELLDNWMRALDRLRVMTYPEAGEGPGRGATPLVRIEYQGDGGDELGYLELVRASGPEGRACYGRSEATGTWARLSSSMCEQLLQDLDEILGQ